MNQGRQVWEPGSMVVQQVQCPWIDSELCGALHDLLSVVSLVS